MAEPARKAFVVGHPIAHSRSPKIHGHWLKRYGIDGSYAPLDVAPADFGDFLKGLAAGGFAGGNVTIPHKEAAFALAERRDEAAATIGAAIAVPGTPVVCLTGDGGFQFTLPEIGAALDAEAPVIFVVWNNRGYREIETSMRDVGVEPVGVSPAPPDFGKLAEAYGIAAEKLSGPHGLREALLRATAANRPCLIEISVE